MEQLDLVKIGQVAKVTGISKWTLYRGVHDKSIPYYRYGRAVRFRIAEVLAWMREQAKKGNGIDDQRPS